MEAGKRGRGKAYHQIKDSVTQVSSNLETTNGDIKISSGVGNIDAWW